MPNIAILSVNHQLAPVEIREKVAFSQNELTSSISKLLSIPGVYSCVILSTCNRSELYVVSDLNQIEETLGQYLANTHGIDYKKLLPYLSYFKNDAAVSHICNVAAGLDSMALGEPQIFGQLKDAYQFSKKNKTLDKTLEKLFQHAFATAKKVRTDTKIGASPVSVAYCAVKLSEKIFTNLSDQTVLLIGAGEMIELSAQHLKQKGVSKMIVANRTIENAQSIATAYGAEAISLKQLSEHLHRADIVISSTAAPIPILGKGLIETVLVQRKHAPVLLLDLAIPRDIEPEAGKLDDVFLYTVDDLQQVVENNLEGRKQEKIVAQEIIKKQNLEFKAWLDNIPNEEIIKQYHHHAMNLKDDAIKSALKKLSTGSEVDVVIQELADQLTNKILHAPFKNIKQTPSIDLEQCKFCIPNTSKKSIKVDNT